MAGDVRGTFDLNDRPATAAMRRLKREATELDTVLVRVGESVDNVFSSRNIAEAEEYAAAVRGVKDDLRELGRIRATPKIDLDGVTQALGQVELLERRLNSLSRRVASPRVGIPQSALAAGAATRAAGGGGGGGSSLGLGSLRVPLAGAVPWWLVGGAVAAAPPLLGATTALGGSLGQAALGAGSIGLGAAGVGAAGIGMTAPIAISSINGLKEASKALESYRKEVIKSGVNSETARQKYRLYNMELEKAPAGAARLLRAKEGLVEDFRSRTRPAQAGFTGSLTRGLNLGRQLTPLYSQQANQFFGQVQPQFDQYADFLNSGSSRQFYEAMGGEATKALRPTENIAENVTATLMNLSRASRPFFREGLHFLDRWTGDWRTSSRDIKGARDDMRGWVDDLKAWGKLTGATFDLLGDLGGAGAGSGRSLVTDLTDQLEVWDQWIERNPREVRNFFHDSVDSTEKLAEATGKIFNLVWKIGRELGPLLNQFSELVTLVGNAGLLTPGGLPLLLAGGAGIRNGTRGLLTRGGSGAAGTVATAGGGAAMAGAPMIMGGGGWGTRAGSARYGAALEGLPITAAGAARAGYLSRVVAAGRVPVMRPTVPGGLTMGMEAEAGLIGATRFSPRAAAGAAGRMLYGGVAPRAKAFGGGFARSFGPYAALSGALGAMGTEGDLMTRLEGGFSQATLGLVPAPPTTEQLSDKGAAQANHIAQQIMAGPGTRQQKLARLRQAIRHTQELGGQGYWETHGKDSLLSKVGLVGDDSALSDDERHTRIAQLRGSVADFRGFIGQQQTQRAEGMVGQIGGAFGIRARHGADEGENYTRSLRSIERRVDKLHGRTKDQFAQMGLDWAGALAKANPKLKRAYNEMLEEVETRLHQAGRQVRIINGNIVDTSAQSWGKVADVIGTETQRAYSEANENLTALEKRAMTILSNMGYSRSESRNLVYEAQHGHPSRAGAQASAGAHHHGRVAPTVNSMGNPGRNAAGGRLPVPANGSLHDQVYIGNGQWAAGDELMVNRHTERRINRLLGGATTLGHEVAHESRAHSQSPASPVMERNAALGARLNHAVATRRFATGGIGAAAGLARRMGLHAGEGPGEATPGVHTAGSLHYSGLAYDISGSADAMWRYRRAAERLFRGSINELFYDPYPYYLDEGHKVPGSIGGHSDHVHIGFFPGGAKLRRGGGRAAGLHGAGRGAAPQIDLGAPRTRRGGVGGAAVNAAGAMEAGGLEHNINRLLSRRGGAGAGVGRLPRGGGVEGQIARALFRGGLNKIGAAGVIGNAYAESSMNPAATGYGGGGLWGFTSSPYSLADLQAYASQKGKPWTNAGLQSRFLLQFIGDLIPRLNASASPEAAAALFMSDFERPGIPRQDVREQGARRAFEQGYSRGGRRRGFAGWYGQGGRGRAHGPTLIGVGESGPEDFEITPTPKRGRAGRGGAPIQPIVHVNMGGVTVHGAKDTERVGKEIGRHAARELTKALQESDDVSDKELVGG